MANACRRKNTLKNRGLRMGSGPGFLARDTGITKVGLYARVSTHDQQTLALPREAMAAYARQRGWSIVMMVEDVSSGASERRQREGAKTVERLALVHLATLALGGADLGLAGGVHGKGSCATGPMLGRLARRRRVRRSWGILGMSAGSADGQIQGQSS